MPRLRSWIGRYILGSAPPEESAQTQYLNMGCGENRLEGFLNADFFYPLKRWRQGPEWMLDLDHPLNCPDSRFKGILLEHVIEHFEFEKAKRVLREMHRILKPGGVLRVSTPSLGILVQAYQDLQDGREIPSDLARIVGWTTDSTPADLLHHLVYKWGHQSVWDGPRIEKILREVGFGAAREVGFREGTDSHLFRDLEARRPETVYVEGIK